MIELNFSPRKTNRALVRECLVEGVPPPMPAWAGTAGTGDVMSWYGSALTLREEGRLGEVKFLGCARAPSYKAKVGPFW